jgi:hypothetical protein
MKIYVNPMEDLQEESRLRNQAEADRLCKNICLCIGWSSLLLFFCYIILVSIVMKLGGFDDCPDKKCEELLIIEEYYSGSEGD